jgi:uncharacterized protein (DUF302 family)
MIHYGFTKELNKPLEQALEMTTAQLKEEGFGVLSRIDIDQKLKEKLGVEFKRYLILGVCHPSSAYRALLAEENVGLLLPCNVVLYEKEDKTVVSILKPTVAMQLIPNEALGIIARDVEAKLQRVFEQLK